MQMDTFPIGIMLCDGLDVQTPWAHLLYDYTPNWSPAPLRDYMVDLYGKIPSGEAATICDVHTWPSAAHLPWEVRELARLCLEPDVTRRPTAADLLQQSTVFAGLEAELPSDSLLRQVRAGLAACAYLH